MVYKWPHASCLDKQTASRGIITQLADETGHEFRLYIFCDICGAKLMPFEHIIF